MATISADFDSYKYWCYSSHPYEAMVYCYRSTAYVGRIVFFNDGAALPPNANLNGPSIHFPISRFGDIIDTLRTEKPLYLFLNLENLVGSLGTADFEPVGEEEG
ncbi:MAG: hypothetical protein ACRD2W_13155 [Acidimicrobiales bacterium]